MANTDEAKLNELLAGLTVDEPGLLRLRKGTGSRRPLRMDPDELAAGADGGLRQGQAQGTSR